MIIMNAMQHQLKGESATNSQRGSPSPVVVGMLEQVPPDRRHTAQNSNRIRAVVGESGVRTITELQWNVL